jgi:hypothetical protein
MATVGSSGRFQSPAGEERLAVVAAVLVPVLIHALVILAAHGVPQPSTLPGAEMLGFVAPYAPQIGAIAVGLLIMGRKFGAWTFAVAALYVPGMLQLLQWLMIPMAANMGYPVAA